jgi:predicted DNA-binding transcriptional regulator AlpA
MARFTESPNIHQLQELIESLEEIVIKAPVDLIPTASLAIAALQSKVAARLLANSNGTHADSADRLLTATEAAPFVGVSPDWLYDHAEQLSFAVRLPAAKAKNGSGETKTHLRFSAHGIQKWIRSRSGR